MSSEPNKSRRKILVLCLPTLLTVASCLVYACGILEATPVPVDRETFMVSAVGLVNAENNFAIFYKAMSNDSAEPQIQIFEHNGAPVLSISPLAAVPEAVDCAVWGVSIGSSGLVAVTAVFRDGSGLPPVGALLIYSRDGTLQKALRYSAYLIMGVEVDSQDHIWALNGGANVGGDPRTFPVLVEYDRDGNILKTAFTFSEFPEDAVSVEQGEREGGAVSFGLTSGKVWFWFPHSRRLGIVNTDGTDPQVVYTGLPPWPGIPSESPVSSFTAVDGAAYLPGGRLLTRVTFFEGQPTFVSLYQFDLNARKWMHLSPPRSVDIVWGWFAGVDDGRMVWMLPTSHSGNNPSSKEIELDWIPLPSPIVQSTQ
jgi:hypothetical protein